MTKTKNWWPSSSIAATASSSNIGSMAKRLTLTIRGFAARTLRAVGEATQDLLLLLRAGPQARLLLVVDRLALDLVDDLVDRGLVGRSRSRGCADAPMDDQRHVGEVGVGGALVVLVPELDGGIGLIVEEPLESA